MLEGVCVYVCAMEDVYEKRSRDYKKDEKGGAVECPASGLPHR